MEKTKVFPMQKHTLLINVIANKIKAKSYLEIGIFNPDHNFDRVNVIFKEGIDPSIDDTRVAKMTSDEFFEVKKIARYDLIFCDGLHHADQVKRDIINSWKVLNEGGCILIHDTNPHSESITHVPRDSREWCGNVYQTICQIDEPEIFTLKDDYGVTVIRKEGELKINDDVVDWEWFDEFRHGILNLKTWDECIKIIEGWE